jgi:hypothetical protein
MASRRASVQSRTQAACGRPQLPRSAGQISPARSSLQPGRALQSTGIQRERARTIVGPSAVSSDGAVRARAGSLAAGAGIRLGGPGVPHPESTDARAASIIAAMTLLLLEALAALAVLVFIVWWTMFSGRSGGERKPPGDDDPAA